MSTKKADVQLGAVLEAAPWILVAAAELLAGGATSADAVGEILAQVLTLVRAPTGWVFLADEDAIFLRAQIGCSGREARATSDTLERCGLLSHIQRTGTTLVFPSPAVSADVSNEVLEATRAGSMVVAPLIAGGENEGVLVLASPGPGEGEKWARSISAIAVQLAQSLSLVRAFEQMRERARVAELASHAGGALLSGTTVRDALQRSAEAIATTLDAAVVRIWVAEDGRRTLELQASAGLEMRSNNDHGRIRVGHQQLGILAEKRRPHFTNSAIGDRRVPDQEWVQKEGMIAFAAYPLLADGDLVGVMALFARQGICPFVLRSLTSVADVLAVGIRNRKT